MSVAVTESSFVVNGAQTISLSQMVSVTASSADPTYLVVTGLDRDEYTAGATDKTGTLSGNGRTDSFSSIGSDGRGIGITFTYQASTGRYYNSTYGYLDQLTYTASGSLDDLTNLSLFGTNSLSLADEYADNPYAMMQLDPGGYLGSVTVATEPSFTGSVPAQATPDSLAAVAATFVGKAWNMDGCWVLASTIAAEAGASLPVQSTAIGLPGQANGEWIVAYNGPAGQFGNWQAMVTAGEIVVIGTAGGGGHITTCVSGSGASAMLIDNVTYVGSGGQVTNLANDGSSSDIVVAAPHLASQEWSGVQASSVVIYELDTPTVTDAVSSASLAGGKTCSLTSLFAVTDPGNKTITEYQVYDSAGSDSLEVNGAKDSAHTAATAVTAGSLSSVVLAAGATACTDTLDLRAYNGSYWGDWQSISVAVSATTAPAPTPTVSPPKLAIQTPNQTWLQGARVAFALPAGTFVDPQGQKLTYAARLANGQALPAWLVFTPSTDAFNGVAPAGMETLSLTVTATDTSGLSVADTFQVSVPAAAPVVTNQTAPQTLSGGKSFSLALPANTFADPQNEALHYTATLSSGLALPSWLSFNASTDTFSGTAPTTAQTLSLKVSATDTSGLSASESVQLSVTAAAAPPTVAHPTAAQVWNAGKSVALTLPANTFSDPQGRKLTYTATLSSGQALPTWLSFNAATESFSGTAPITPETLGIKVMATDTSGLSASETFVATVQPSPPVLANPTPGQTWTDGASLSFIMPKGTFTDPQGSTLTYTAFQTSGANATSWLHFNGQTETFSGSVPANLSGTIGIEVFATNAAHLATPDAFSVTFAAAAGSHLATAGLGLGGTASPTDLLAFHS